MTNLTTSINLVLAWMLEHPEDAAGVTHVDITNSGVCAVDVALDTMQRMFAGQAVHSYLYSGWEHLESVKDGITFRSMRKVAGESKEVVL